MRRNIAFDADGVPHIVYRPNGSYFEVRIAAGDREPWTNELAAATKESVYNRLTGVALAPAPGGAVGRGAAHIKATMDVCDALKDDGPL